MKLLQTIGLNLKKIKYYKGKSVFVILPISVMFALLVVASSEAQSLIKAAEKSIFSSIQSQNEVIELNKDGNFTSGFGGARRVVFGQDEDTGYTNADISTLSGIVGVEKSSLVSEIPIKNIWSEDLVAGKTIKTTSLAGLDSEYAKLYTNSSFTYKEGEAIPIILNANDFKEEYQDWQGKDEITVDLSKLRATFGGPNNTSDDEPNEDPIASQNPNKTRAVSYDKNDLIGKTITVKFGGLDAIQNYTQEPSSSGFSFKKKTTTELNDEIAARKTELSKYWNYSKISKPIEYKFVIVGVAEGTDKTKTYVPTEFANKVLQDYTQNEKSARNTTAIDTDDLNSKFQGLVYDGVTLKDDALNSLFSGFRRQVNVQQEGNAQRIQLRQAPDEIKIGIPDQSESYYIPGLVMKKDRTTEEITGEYKDFKATATLPLESRTILVKIKNVEDRASVVTALNDKGYTYQDNSKVDEFNKLKSSLSTTLNIASIAVMVITAVFVLLNMAKLVSESRKEIGIFRAMGSTRTGIRKTFLLQSLMYVLISIILGTALGVGLIYAFSGPIVNSAQEFINSTIDGILPLTGSISKSDFTHVNYQSIGIYVLVMLGVTLIASIWPSEQASRVSPIEAIRN